MSREPRQLESEGLVTEAEVCSALGLTPKRLQWLVAKGHVVPAVRARRGQPAKFFVSLVRASWESVVRVTTFEGKNGYDKNGDID